MGSNKEWCSELFYIKPYAKQIGYEKAVRGSLEQSRPTTCPWGCVAFGLIYVYFIGIAIYIVCGSLTYKCLRSCQYKYNIIIIYYIIDIFNTKFTTITIKALINELVIIHRSLFVDTFVLYVWSKLLQ